MGLSFGDREVTPKSAEDTAGAELVDAILSRRSVREGFTQQTIPEDTLERIIQSGLAAPSSKGAKPWGIHIVGEDDLNEIADLVRRAKGADSYRPVNPATGEQHKQFVPTVAESADVLDRVNLGLFIENRHPFSLSRQIVEEALQETQDDALTGYTFEVLGIGAAIQNIQLAAHAQGLGSVFMGDILIAKQEISERLSIVGDLVGVIALGYTTELPGRTIPIEGQVVDHR